MYPAVEQILQAIIDGIENQTITNTEIEVVISNNKNAYALERAKQHGIKSICISPKDYASREEFNEDVLETAEFLSCGSGCAGRIPCSDSGADDQRIHQPDH